MPPSDSNIPKSPSPQVQKTLLTARAVTKRFPGLIALDHVDFTLRSGEIHALMGENGAGKSTLIKALTGALQPDEGDIILEGKPIQPKSPAEAVTLGISTVYQELNLAPNLSVAENISLGREPRGLFGIRWREVFARADRALERIGTRMDVHMPLGSCSTAHQQLVAIARALDIDAKALILDEPTSSLDRQEVEQLFAVMRRLKVQGLGIVFITHFIDQVYEISDRITVLRNGAKVTEQATAGLSKMGLVQAMTGRDPSAFKTKSPGGRDSVPAKSETLLTAENLGRRRSIEGINLEIHRGQTVGFAGLLGSGRTEAIRLLYGMDEPDSGRITYHTLRIPKPSVRKAIKNGLGLCPEDRKAQGILPQLSVSENTILALQAKRGWFRPLSRKQKQELVEQWVAQLHVVTNDIGKPMNQLSGGNQQKVILARWLAAEPHLLLLDEPTRGIDVGAKFEIMSEIERLRESGMAFVFVSSEIPEVIRASGAVVVFRDRKMIGLLSGGDITEEHLMKTLAEGTE